MSKKSRVKVWNSLVGLKLYFAKDAGAAQLYSNYFLIGYREKNLIISPGSVIDSLDRINLFFKACIRSGIKPWVAGVGGKHSTLVRWFSGILKLNFILILETQGILFQVSGRYFWIHHGAFSHKLTRFAGLDVLLLPHPGSRDKLSEVIGHLELPIVGVEYPDSKFFSNYCLPVPENSPARSLTYARLLAHMFKGT